MERQITDAVLSLLKEEKLYAREIKKRLNIRHDKTLNRILKKLEEYGLIEKIEYPDFEKEGIIDKDRRHIYYKYIGENVSPWELNKKKIWNRIIYDLEDIVRKNKKVVDGENDKKKIDFYFREFLEIPEMNVYPSFNYSNIASIKDLNILLTLLSKMDDDQRNKYEIPVIHFILYSMDKFKEENMISSSFISLMENYFEEVFKNWIDMKDKWNPDNKYLYILKDIITIFIVVKHKDLWDKIIKKFFDGEILEKLNEENITDPYYNILNFLIAFMSHTYIRNEFLKHESDLFGYQRMYLF
ncbi:MAG: winged helix-turn-helix domain-containing protein, partial [Minisyncoccia bacterium]